MAVSQSHTSVITSTHTTWYLVQSASSHLPSHAGCEKQRFLEGWAWSDWIFTKSRKRGWNMAYQIVRTIQNGVLNLKRRELWRIAVKVPDQSDPMSTCLPQSNVSATLNSTYRFNFSVRLAHCATPSPPPPNHIIMFRSIHSVPTHCQLRAVVSGLADDSEIDKYGIISQTGRVIDRTEVGGSMIRYFISATESHRKL